MVGWLLWQRMDTTVPTLNGYPGIAVTPCCLCKPSSAPRLAPALNLGQGAQGRTGPVSCRAGFLHSSVTASFYHVCSRAGGSLG